MMSSSTCSLKWLDKLQHEILNQLIIYITLGITLGVIGGFSTFIDRTEKETNELQALAFEVSHRLQSDLQSGTEAAPSSGRSNMSLQNLALCSC